MSSSLTVVILAVLVVLVHPRSRPRARSRTRAFTILIVHEGRSWNRDTANEWEYIHVHVARLVRTIASGTWFSARNFVILFACRRDFSLFLAYRTSKPTKNETRQIYRRKTLDERNLNGRGLMVIRNRRLSTARTKTASGSADRDVTISLLYHSARSIGYNGVSAL